MKCGLHTNYFNASVNLVKITLKSLLMILLLLLTFGYVFSLSAGITFAQDNPLYINGNIPEVEIYENNEISTEESDDLSLQNQLKIESVDKSVSVSEIDSKEQELNETLQGTIVEIIEEKKVEFNSVPQDYQKLKIMITSGSLNGQEIIVVNGDAPMAQVIKYNTNDKVLIAYSKNAEGSYSAYITDYARTDGILVLFSLFVILAIIVAGKRGIYSIVAMGFSFFIIFSFILPQIRTGADPIFIALIASIIIIPITFYLSHGFSKKTSIAVVGTVVAFVLTGLLAVIFVNLTHLTGADTEEALFLIGFNGVDFDLRGLLLAGILIGTLGVLDDITISQTSVVQQLADIKEKISLKELFIRAMQIGKDHISSMINTLVLAYAGASLPLLILFLSDPRPIVELINYEPIASEIVRTLVGSIGLILAVPITTLIACYVYGKSKY